MKKIIISVTLFFFVSKLQAQEAIETDRPDASETPFILPKNFLQFEFGVRKESLADKVSLHTLPVLQVRYGLSKKTELLLIAEYNNIKYGSKLSDSSGVLKISPAARFNIIEGRGLIPHTTLLVESGFNKYSSKKNSESSLFSPEIRLTMNNTVTEGISLKYNLGAEWEDVKESPEWVYTLTPEFEFSEKWNGYVEFFGGLKEGEVENNFDAGIQYKVTNNFAVDIFAGKALGKSNAGFFAGIGAAIRFKTKK